MTRIPFVYLTSPPFSGSTLFSFLVNTHPEIATVGEMTGIVKSKDPETYQCSCGEKIRKCLFWKQIAAQMESRQFSFDPAFFDTTFQLGSNRFAQRVLNASLRSAKLEDIRDQLLKFWPRQRHRLAYLVARNKALAASILQVTGKTVFFDASKNPALIRHLHREPDVDLRVVHLVRDVRGTSLSRRKNKSETNWCRSVNAWIRINRNIERQLGRLPAHRWMRIRYEDLCNTPSETLNRFFEFCGLEPHDLHLDFHSVQHHIVGNRMRLAKIGQVRLDESWRLTLNRDELACAKKLAGSMHSRYGYAQMRDSDLHHQLLA
jgi:hypothetical protein